MQSQLPQHAAADYRQDRLRELGPLGPRRARARTHTHTHTRAHARARAALQVLLDSKGSGQFITCFVIEAVHLLKGG